MKKLDLAGFRQRPGGERVCAPVARHKNAEFSPTGTIVALCLLRRVEPEGHENQAFARKPVATFRRLESSNCAPLNSFKGLQLFRYFVDARGVSSYPAYRNEKK
ncbi:MAG TPA: hypothetical protein VGO96_07355 [Pyrinomonadaceae bacterium]|nr:hypothetical protein [Pyrinomonadaceae bacterium]